MKKKLVRLSVDNIYSKNYSNKMKLTLLLLLTIFWQASALNSYAQRTEINLSFEDASLLDVIRSIEQQTEFVFLYSNEQVNTNSKVNIQANDASIYDVLDKVLANYTYRVENRQIVLLPKSTQQAVRKIRGTITDDSGDPVIGANVVLKETTTGTITDIDGNFSLEIPATGNPVLLVSYIGYLQREVRVGNQDVIQITLNEDTQKLDEIVVVGYGTSKAKDLTSPIAVVSSDEITKHAASSAMSAVQGKVAGVQIVNKGAPGSGPEVRIRGVGSFGDTQPLYVVDGMFYSNINFLNPSDISSITILKDASAASIYGVRAANGVVLVTTKQGGVNKPTQVTYDGYMGVQTVTNRLKMANSAQYTAMQLEKGSITDRAILEKSIELFGGDLATMKLAIDTDWYEELLRNALIHSHSIDVTGGSEKTAYSFGANYFQQDGIMNAKNSYERFNLRAKVDAKATSWLKLGINLVLSNANQHSPSNEADAWRFAYTTPGIIPVMDERRTDEEAFPIKYASPSQLGMGSFFSNPVSYANYNKSLNKNLQILPVFYAEAQFLEDKLTIRSQYSQDIAFVQDRRYVPVVKIGGNQDRNVSSLTKNMNLYHNWIWDNTATYRESIDKHDFSVMLGQSARQENYRNMNGTAPNVPDTHDEYLYLSQGNPAGREVNDDGTTYNGMSFFTRVTYNFDSKYMLSATMRADGSSKYQEKWGYFPSVGAAWSITSEDFMEDQSFFDLLKLRGSWGKLGNDKIPANNGFASIETGLDNSGVFGNTTVLPGYTNLIYFSHLAWEVVNETNVGLDIRTLKDRLHVELDYYNRTTENAVISVPIPMSSTTLLRNSGTVRNSGIEVSVDWSDRIGKDFSYWVGGNLTTLKNSVRDLNGLPYIYGGSAEFRTISRIGDALNSYYGYEVAGVYQTEAEIAADPIAVANGLEPGDFKYVDQNKDGKIDNEDRVIIGKALPDVMWGLNVGFEWKKFEFSTLIQGQWGNQIVNRKRGDRRWQTDINYDAAWVEKRWTGEGSTNEYMSAKGSVKPWNLTNFNSWYVESGAFWRIQNIQVAYNILEKKPNSKAPGIRVNFTAERPFTSFKTNGFTPEIADGFDQQVYPLAAVYSFGLKLTF